MDSGSTAIFNCTTQGSSVQPLFSWLKDGLPIRGFDRHEISQKGNYLSIHNVMKEDKGIYQCLARDPDTDETAQASVLLSLGGIKTYYSTKYLEQHIYAVVYFSCITRTNRDFSRSNHPNKRLSIT